MDSSSAPLTGWKKYNKLLKRNFLSIFFPVAVGSAIYWDLSKTRKFKTRQALKEKKLEEQAQG